MHLAFPQAPLPPSSPTPTCAALACSCLAPARIPSHARLQAGVSAGVRMELGEGIACAWHDRGVRMLMLVEVAGMALAGPAAATVGIAPWFAVCGSLMLAVHLMAFAASGLRALDGEAP